MSDIKTLVIEQACMGVAVLIGEVAAWPLIMKLDSGEPGVHLLNLWQGLSVLAVAYACVYIELKVAAAIKARRRRGQ